MSYDLKYISWEKAKESDEYYYTGDSNTPSEIANMFQELATTNNDERSSIVELKYYDYACELDIFWEDVDFDDNGQILVIELFTTHKDCVINNSERLLISDIYKPNYLEDRMYNFILESID